MNKFFTTKDAKQNKIMFDLEPNFWWSRVYEYPFVLDLIDKTDTVLDLCCGICHPLKFALVSKCKKVYACDKDDLSKNNILSVIGKVFGQEELSKFDTKILDKIDFTQCDATKLTYKDKTFTKIVCISVFEHMSEEDIELTLKEMKRILKDDGKIIITCDYPTITPEKLMHLVKKANLKIDGKFDYSIPSDAILSTIFATELKCFNMVLVK